MSEVAQNDATMSTNVHDSQKTGGHETDAVESDSQIIVALRTGRKITVEDAIWSCDNSLLKLNVEGNGIDVTVTREHVELVIKSRAGAEVINDE